MQTPNGGKHWKLSVSVTGGWSLYHGLLGILPRTQHRFRMRLFALMISGGSRSLTGVCNGKCVWMNCPFPKGFACCFCCLRQCSTVATSVCTDMIVSRYQFSEYTATFLFQVFLTYIWYLADPRLHHLFSVFEETLLTCCVLRGLQAWHGLQCFLILCLWLNTEVCIWCLLPFMQQIIFHSVNLSFKKKKAIRVILVTFLLTSSGSMTV